MAAPARGPHDGPTGAAALVRALERAGSSVVFGVPGPANLDLVVELRNQGVRFVAVNSTNTAILAATGFNGRTGRLGAALPGPGTDPLQMLPGLRDARALGAAIVVLDVAAPLPLTRLRPGDPVPDFPPHPALAEYAAAVIRLGSSDDVGAEVKAARELARKAPGGPVVLHVPAGFARARVAPEPEDGEGQEATSPPKPEPGIEHVQLRRAANLVDQSQNVLIWAGGGAMRAGAGGAVAELAEKVGAPVLTTIHASGMLPARHPCLVGMPPHLPAVGALWDDADLVIGIGTDFDAESTQGSAQPAPDQLISINVDAVDAARNYRPDVLLRGDARTLTKALADTVSYRGGTAVVRAKLDEVRSSVRKQLESAHPNESAFVHAVSAAIPDRATVVSDPCAAGRWLASFHEWTLPRALWFPPSLEGIGQALPAAIGAAAAGSTEPVLAIIGDQGLLASFGELTVVAREKLPLTILVVDDGGAGRLRPLLDERDLDPSTLDRPSPDFAAAARTFGLRADTIEVVGEDLTAALRAHIAAPDPTILVVQARLKPPPTERHRWYRVQRAGG